MFAEEEPPKKQRKRSSKQRQTDNASPIPDSVTSAANAMLKLSNSVPNPCLNFVINNMGTREVQSDLGQGGGDTSNDSTSNSVRNFLSSTQQARRQREFIPAEKKDDSYWKKRQKNNEAAKKSREKRRINDAALGIKVDEAEHKNKLLKRELRAIKKHFKLDLNVVFKGNHDDADDSVSEDDRSMEVKPIIIKPHTDIQNQPKVENKLLSPKMSHPIAAQLHHFAGGPFAGLAGMQPGLPGTAIPLIIPMANHQQPPVALLSHMSHLPQTLIPSVTSLPVGHPQGPSVTRASSGSPASLPSEKSRQGDKKKVAKERFVNNWAVSPDSRSNSPPSLQIDFSPASTNEESDLDSSVSREQQNGHRDNHEHMRERGPWNMTSDSSAPASPQQKSRARDRKGVPHKLWHNVEEERYDDDLSDSEEMGDIDTMSNTNTDDPDNQMLDQDDPDQPLMSDQDGSKDPRYTERRWRNNMAARKCRENRRRMNDIRIAQSNQLESENDKLKKELQSLSREVGDLKDMIEKKHMAKLNGQNLDIPKKEDLSTTNNEGIKQEIIEKPNYGQKD